MQSARARGEEVLPPYQEGVVTHHGAQALPAYDGQWSPYVETISPEGKTWMRTCTSPDGTVITEVGLNRITSRSTIVYTVT